MKRKKWIALACALALLIALCAPAGAEGVHYGSHPADDV